MSNENSGEEIPSDILSITAAGYGAARIEAGGLLRGGVDARPHGDVDFGVQVHQDGSSVSLGVGTTYPSEQETGEKCYVFCGITTDQAREIAAALEEAADKADELETDTEPDTRGLVERLLGGVTR